METNINAKETWNSWNVYQRAKWALTNGLELTHYDVCKGAGKQFMEKTWDYIAKNLETSQKIDYNLPAMTWHGDELRFISRHELLRAIESEMYPIVKISGTTLTDYNGEVGTPKITELDPVTAEDMADDYEIDFIFPFKCAYIALVNNMYTICFKDVKEYINNGL